MSEGELTARDLLYIKEGDALWEAYKRGQITDVEYTKGMAKIANARTFIGQEFESQPLNIERRSAKETAARQKASQPSMSKVDPESIKTENYARLNQMAIELAREGRWKEAVALNKGIIDRFPEEVEAYNRLGKAYAELKDFTSAKESYRRAVRIDEDNVIAKKRLNQIFQTYHPTKAVLAVPKFERFKDDPVIAILMKHPDLVVRELAIKEYLKGKGAKEFPPNKWTAAAQSDEQYDDIMKISDPKKKNLK
jgi:tetratricopeptide (TPR) repeat protein